MKHTRKVRRLTRSIMGLFGANKSNVTRLNHKDEYYKDYYFSKQMCDGIKLVADIEQCSKKEAADMLIRSGFSNYMGGKLTEHINADRLAREHNEKMKITRFVMLLRRYARERGHGVSNFI